MGAICVRQSEEQLLVREYNTSIRDIIREETAALKGEHRWADLLFRRLKLLKNESLFRYQFQIDIQRFRRNNSSLYANSTSITNSIDVKLHGGTLADEFKDSCLIPQDEFSKGDITTGDNLPGKPVTEDQSFNDRAARNPSMVMQMSIIYKSEFLEQRNFNNSVKRFLRWSQIAEEHLNQGFLLVLYRLFAAELIRDLQEGSDSTLRVLLANINESCTQFIHLMVRLYTRVYQLEAVKQEPCGELFKYENLFNFTMTNLFRCSDIMKTLREVLRRKLQPRIQLLDTKMKALRKKPIGYFQISPEFLPQPEASSCQANIEVKSDVSEDHTATSTTPVLYFESSIRRILDVNKAPTPIGKIKSILLASKEIVNEIARFYEGRGREPPNLDPDTITSILMYIIVQSGYPELIVDIQLIEDFSTRNCMSCVSGYYINVIKACFEMIAESNG